MSDRYMKLLLTIIALELLWLAAAGPAQPVAAQPGAVPVIITGIRIDAEELDSLPVAVHGTVAIESRSPLKVEADRPLPVKSVPYTPSERPGE
jgi:hypothetical protein